MSEEQQGPGGLSGWVERALGHPRRFRQFLHEVRVELKNVNWPTWENVRTTTVVVIITVFVFGAFLFVVDQGAGRLVQWFFDFFRAKS
jgi:preprotein translocase subunit SecE